MKLHLTYPELFDYFCTVSGMAPPRTDGVVTRTYGIDFSRMYKPMLEAWYANLVHNEPAELLAPVNLDPSQLLVTPSSDGGGTTVVLPAGTLRVTRVSFYNWGRDAIIVTDPDSPLARRQLHPYTRATADCPVAVHIPGSQRLHIYPSLAGHERIFGLDVIPGDGLFHIDEAALATLGMNNGQWRMNNGQWTMDN